MCRDKKFRNMVQYLLASKSVSIVHLGNYYFKIIFNN